MDPILMAFIGAAGGLAVGWFVRDRAGKANLTAAERRASTIEDEARAKADALTREAEDKARTAVEREQRRARDAEERWRADQEEARRQMAGREEALERQFKSLKRNERFLRRTERHLADRHDEVRGRKLEVETAMTDLAAQLQRVSGLTAEEAKKLMLERAEHEIAGEEALLIKRQVERVKTGVDAEAKRIICNTIQRVASEYTGELTTSNVDLPTEDVKGRVIGKEGRNIRHFEKVTGCDVIVDDTPGAIVISCFEGVRREIGRRAMARLIKDGRIHPARIEEVVAATEQELSKIIRETGEKVCADEGLTHVHPDIVECLGRLQFRTSFGQNVLLHSLEVGHVCGMMASELGLDAQLAKRCGILHDIGKAVDQTQQGSHPALGADIARRCGEREEVIEAVGGHHDDVETVKFAYTVLASAADAVSASRPGARRDNFERYVERLKKLEEISNSFAGVKQSYAIQAGREVRVIASPDAMSDEQMLVVARDIAKRIESELTYPGEVKVTLLRERRVIEYAR